MSNAKLTIWNILLTIAVAGVFAFAGMKDYFVQLNREQVEELQTQIYYLEKRVTVQENSHCDTIIVKNVSLSEPKPKKR